MKAQKSALLVLSLLFSLSLDAGAANSVLYVYPTASDLSSNTSYSTSKTSDTDTAPTTSSDVEFFSTTYTNTTLTINGTNLGYGTLNDLDTTQSLIIDNSSATAGIIDLEKASNSVSGTAADLLYVASGANLTIESSTGTTTLEAGTAGNIDNAGTLAISGVLEGTAGGTVITFTGAGTTTLSGGLAKGTLVINNPGGTVIVNGSSSTQTISASGVTIDAGTLQNNYRINSAVTVNGGTLDGTGYIDGSGDNLTVNGGSVTLTNSSDTWSGNTTIDDNATLNLNNTISPYTAGTYSPLILGSNTTSGGGNLNYNKTSTQTFGSLTLDAGASSIVTASSASDVIDVNAITRDVGSTINIGSGSGVVNTTAANTNFTSAGGADTILGGYATYGGTTWAVGGGNITGLSSYNTGFAAGTDVNATAGTSAPGSMTINSLRFNSSGSYTVNLGGALIVASGGILETTGVGNNAVSINNSTLTSANASGNASGQDLIVIQNNTSNSMTISSQIVDNSVATGLTKSGAGTLILSNSSNNYTGATSVNAGSLLVGQGGNITASSAVTVAAGATFGTPTTNTSATTLLTNSPALTLNLGSTGTQSNLALNLYSSTADNITAGQLTLNALPSGAAGTVLVTVNDTTGNNLTAPSYTLLSWTSTSGTAPATGEFTLAGNAATEGTLSVSGDDLIFTPTSVPEPSTWAIIILGLGMFALNQCRRRQLKAEAEPDSISFF